MILTVKEKIDLLEKVKESLFKEIHMNMYSFGICGYIRVRTGCSIKNSIPELLKHKPIDAGKCWFSMDKAGHGKRIEIINKTISDLENSLQEKEIEKVYFKCKPENILLVKSKENDNIYYNSNDGEISLYVHKFFIKENPDLFIVKTKQDLLNNSLNDKLYKLQEYCKEKIPAKKNEWVNYTFAYRKDKIEIVYYSIRLSDFSFVKFDSEEQAILFLYNIEKTVNQELKNYFINLLKNLE